MMSGICSVNSELYCALFYISDFSVLTNFSYMKVKLMSIPIDLYLIFNIT